MSNEKSPVEQISADKSSSVSRRNFLAGTGALGVTMFPAWGSNIDLFTDNTIADASEVHDALGDEAWDLLTQLTQLNRFGGHPGEQEAADIIENAFESIGLENVTQQYFDMLRWTRGDSELTVLDPVERSFDTIALPYSPAAEIEAELIDVGYGTPSEIEERDVEGKIAIASTDSPEDQRFVHRMETFGHLVDGGAAAFIFANHIEGQLAPTGTLRFNERAEIPGLGVSYEAGAWLTDYAEQGGTARVRVEAEHDTGESQNVHGTLGPDSGEEILVIGHHDAHDIAEGAIDNGAGVATLVTAARLLADVDLECRVRFATVGSEELGLIGSDVLAESLDLDRVRAVINTDGAASARNMVANTQSSEALGEVVNRVEEAGGESISVEPTVSPYSDHWRFLERNVPTVQLGSESDDRGRGWGHTEADTRDKVDPEHITAHARLTALMVLELAHIDPPRISDSQLCAELDEANLEPGMRATGIWPEVCE